MFGPSTIATVTIEDVRDQDEDEVHFHAGGQGFWIARLLGRLGVPTTLCTTIGGESGRVVEALIGAEPIDIRAVKRHGPNGAWVHDRRDGERNVIADTAGPALGRHDTDELRT